NYNFIHYNIVAGSTLHFDHRVQIEIKILSGNSIMIHAKPSDTIKSIKSDIRKKRKLPIHQLYFAGNILQDNATVLNSSKSVLQLSRYAITFTTAERECLKCSSVLVPGDGIILKNCSHTFC
uniref:Ubiquitin-like domain-containing protein n=1 Tax=Amphimedon queenslandica TaxID=400682 RepID=A0A1X7SP88_AMPQE